MFNISCNLNILLVRLLQVIKMKTTLTKRGQTSIPAEIIKHYKLKKGSKLYWLDTGRGIRVIPIPENVLENAKGIARGEKLLEKLLESRRKDRINDK
jgi:bifunctional DNA-binding transcriptional regulator/antitoxin component of YhaV-PrlF toxin-antitoxin module